MNNRILPQEEVQKVQNLIKAHEELKECHLAHRLTPERLAEVSELEQIHIALYLEMLKDLVQTVGALKDLIEIPAEEFYDTITNKGKLSLDEVKMNVMINAMMKSVLGE